MRAIEIKQSQLRITERAIPEVSKNEVLIKVATAGINRPDIMQRKGLYPQPEGASDIPGLEVAGTIIKSNSNTHQIGDRVCALVTGGAYAEYCVANAELCLPMPSPFKTVIR